MQTADTLTCPQPVSFKHFAEVSESRDLSGLSRLLSLLLPHAF